MTMRVVDRQLYIGDEARPIYLAGLFGKQPYYIPVDDVAALDQRRFWWTTASVVAFAVFVSGAAAGTWSIWWAVLGGLAPFGAPLIVAHWVRGRFEPVSDPSITSDVRRTAVLRGPTMGAALMMLVIGAMQSSLTWLDRYKRPVSFVLVCVYFVTSVIGLVMVKRGRDEFGDGRASPPSGVTR
jgi:hypothetical protein